MVSKKLHDLMIKRSTENFYYRLKNKPTNIPHGLDNIKLYAGSPMYWYCKYCGWLTDIKEENWFLKQPRTVCGECKEMKKLGVLDKILKAGDNIQ